MSAVEAKLGIGEGAAITGTSGAIGAKSSLGGGGSALSALGKDGGTGTATGRISSLQAKKEIEYIATAAKMKFFLMLGI